MNKFFKRFDFAAILLAILYLLIFYIIWEVLVDFIKSVVKLF